MSALDKEAIVRLATVSLVDMNVTGEKYLYKVPYDNSCLVAFIIVRRASASMTTATYSFGFNTPTDDDVIASDYYAELVDDTVYVKIQPKLGAKIGNGGEVLYMNIGTAQGSAATVTVEVFGYLF